MCWQGTASSRAVSGTSKPDSIVAPGLVMNPAAVHIPSQGSVGFEVFLPSEADAKSLAKVLDRQMGHGTSRTQKNYAVKATELKWLPKGKMPGAKDFAAVVARWAKSQGYSVARDMRAFREGLSELQGLNKTAHDLTQKLAAKLSEDVLVGLARGLKLLERLETWVRTFNSTLARADNQGLSSALVWQDDFLPFFAYYDKALPDLQAVDSKLEVLWSNIKAPGVRQTLSAARRALTEPTGAGSITFATNRFEFWPHPTKGEHIAYRVADLKAWAKAFLEWTVAGQKTLTNLLDDGKK